MTHVQSWCAEHSLEHVALHSATIKKAATGRGNAKKPEVLAAARARFGDVKDDNEADALWMLDIMLREVA